jgi:hypothetical protein
MSLPKQFYETYKAITACNLVTGVSCTADDMKEFETLLNKAQVSYDTHDPESLCGHYSLARAMYRSNPRSYLSYITRPANNVCALILWTESKHIVNFFGLRNLIYLSWVAETDTEAAKYVVAPYKADYNKVATQQDSNTDSNTEQRKRYSTVRSKHAFTAPSRISQRRSAVCQPTVNHDTRELAPDGKWADAE